MEILKERRLRGYYARCKGLIRISSSCLHESIFIEGLKFRRIRRKFGAIEPPAPYLPGFLAIVLHLHQLSVPDGVLESSRQG